MMHQEVLTTEAKKLLPYFKKFKPHYYLAGGTALAMQLGHRISIDFDFFSEKKISQTLLPQIENLMPENTIIKPVVNNSDELTIFADGIKITFLYYPFPLIKSLILLNEVLLPPVQELAAMKAYTIGRRGDYKDYVDLYYLLFERHTSLQEIIEIAKTKYANNFYDSLFLEQLIYLDDINITEIKLLKNNCLTKELLKDFFEQKVKELEL